MAKEYKGSVYDRARKLGKKSGYAAEEQEGGSGRRHPATTKRSSAAEKPRKKPKPTGMAPREGGKRKEYGRPIKEGVVKGDILFRKGKKRKK